MRKSPDYSLILIILALGAISLLILYSLNKNLALNQLFFWVIGLSVLAAVSFFNSQNWQNIAVPFYILVLFLLISLFFIAEPVRGSIRWIDLGFFRFQPSEIAKVVSILILSSYFQKKSASQFKYLLGGFLLILPFFVLVFFQPDIGNSLLFLVIFLGIAVVSGLKIRTLFFLFILFFILSLTIFRFLAPYQKERLYSFINPTADPLGTGYSLIQSKIAVGSGQFLGRGLGRGTQSQLEFLPETESDFIFASVAEQLGFLGAGVVIMLYSLLFVKLISLSKNTDRFAQLILSGSITYLFFQFAINIGMNLGLLPVTGITLPFFSYGGSSLISILFLIGVIQSFKKTPTFMSEMN